MKSVELSTPSSREDCGARMYQLVTELYPICRSITGDGVRKTLRLVGGHVPLSIHEVPTGTRVFDWIVPREWNITDAYIKNSRGERVVDFRKSNLHVVNYSVPVHQHLRLAELRQHLFTLPQHPEWIPYRATYYRESWGFCLPERQLGGLADDVYEVCIDSSLEDGSLTYGECYFPGTIEDEVLVSCHICHPSLCNDNLSGIAVAVGLAQILGSRARKHSYRFLFIPSTIGAIAWLALNETQVSRIKHGLVLACLGDAGKSTYKKSRRGDAEIDRVVIHVLEHSGQPYEVLDFTPYGYDERQFCAPGFNLPVGCLMRTPHGRFPQYHTSADDLTFIQPAALADSAAKCLKVFETLEDNKVYINQSPKCEPQLGRRGLYEGVKDQSQLPDHEAALLWVLNLSDGGHSLLDIAERAKMNFDAIKRAADALATHGLLREGR
jgi:aminopeptidase-like protein